MFLSEREAYFLTYFIQLNHCNNYDNYSTRKNCHVMSHSSIYNLKCYIKHYRKLYIIINYIYENTVPLIKPTPDIYSYLKVKRQRRFHRFGFYFDSLLTRKNERIKNTTFCLSRQFHLNRIV